MILQLQPVQTDQRPAIVQLLENAHLPTKDLPAELTDFVVALHSGAVVGVAGLERFDAVALLRSVAVDAAFQGQGIARQLTQHLLAEAHRRGVKQVYLITTTANTYFKQLGFMPIERSATPDAIQQTDQFSRLCPTSAIIMNYPV